MAKVADSKKKLGVTGNETAKNRSKIERVSKKARKLRGRVGGNIKSPAYPRILTVSWDK